MDEVGPRVDALCRQTRLLGLRRPYVDLGESAADRLFLLSRQLRAHIDLLEAEFAAVRIDIVENSDRFWNLIVVTTDRASLLVEEIRIEAGAIHVSTGASAVARRHALLIEDDLIGALDNVYTASHRVLSAGSKSVDSMGADSSSVLGLPLENG